MASLEDLIRAVVKKGDLTHLTLAPTSKGEWQAAWRPASSTGYRMSTHEDPIVALVDLFRTVRVKAARPADDDEDLIG
jgi:hypothetical protein